MSDSRSHVCLQISINHDQRIKALDTVHVYHFGERFLVEVHVVFEEPETTLQMAHDVAESLQVKLEKLPYVERAFVHCDYQFDGDEHVWFRNLERGRRSTFTNIYMSVNKYIFDESFLMT